MKSRIIIFVFILTFSGLHAQNDPEISSPRLNFANDELEVRYDIYNAEEEHLFRIWLEIKDSDGSILKTNSLSGDIGNNIRGGNNKKILWDLAADNILLREEIFVKVIAEITSKPRPVIESKFEEEVEKVPETEKDASLTTTKYSMGTSMARTLIYPGLGLVSQDQSKLHLLKGATAYGCILGFAGLKISSANNYNLYLNAYDIESSNRYYDKAVRQDKLSQVLIYSGIGIWIGDMVWTAISTSRLNKGPFANRRISIGTEYSAQLNSPLLRFSYDF